MRYLFIPMVVFLFWLALPEVGLTHSGNTDIYGCHNDYSTNTYHCHNTPEGADECASEFDRLASMEIIEARYRHCLQEHGEDFYYEERVSDSTNYPDYDYSTPSCPALSFYDNTINGCRCVEGFVVQNGSCVEAGGVCLDSYGVGSFYDSSEGGCKCRYGYLFYNNECVENDSYCQDTLGRNTEYNTREGACECKNGYVLNNEQTDCVKTNPTPKIEIETPDSVPLNPVVESRFDTSQPKIQTIPETNTENIKQETENLKAIATRTKGSVSEATPKDTSKKQGFFSRIFEKIMNFFR